MYYAVCIVFNFVGLPLQIARFMLKNTIDNVCGFLVINICITLETMERNSEANWAVCSAGRDDSIFSGNYLKRAASERGRSLDTSCPASPTHHSAHHQTTCSTSVLLLVLHAGSVLGTA